MYSGQDASTPTSAANKPMPKGAKHGIDVRAGTKARTGLGVSIRNKNRAEALAKKRRGANENENMDLNNLVVAYDDDGNLRDAAQLQQTPAGSDDPWAYTMRTAPELLPLRLLDTFAAMASSEDPQATYHGVLMIRKLLSVSQNPPIQAVLDTKVLPKLVQHLKRDDWLELQFEALWAVSNIAAGETQHTHTVIRCDAVQELIRLVTSNHEHVREQATWAVGNIAGNSASCRDYILVLNGMRAILTAIEMPAQNPGTLRNAAWALSNLCRSKPVPKIGFVESALPVLAGLLHHHDAEVATSACWAISYITEGPLDRITKVLQSQVLQRIVLMLQSPSMALMVPALRTVGNIFSGTDAQSQVIIDSGALNAFSSLLQHQTRLVVKEALWCLSNVAAGSVDQVQALINTDLYPLVVDKMDAMHPEVRKEAVWTVANTTSVATTQQMWFLVECNAIPALCRALYASDLSLVKVALEALISFLSLGAEDQRTRGAVCNSVAKTIIESGSVEKLEELQLHLDEDVAGNAISIIHDYFPHEAVDAHDPSDSRFYYNYDEDGRDEHVATRYNFTDYGEGSTDEYEG
jgi:importin subunit alpha-1